MIVLQMDKPRAFKAGEVVHLKVVDIQATSPGRWRLSVQDVTPLPGAQTSYFCDFCFIGQPAQEDGSLPQGWIERKAEKRTRFACEDCTEDPMCRVCGCTNQEACTSDKGPCSWVEPNLCSACAEPANG